MPESLIRNIADTALWAAVFRGRESEREDALFRDPFARRLAGARGEEIFNTMQHGNANSWAWVMRTYLFDLVIAGQIAQGIDMVINLAAGLDARPYRMDLPESLRWVEVDLPSLFNYKEAVLGDEKPRCELERVRMNLADRNARRQLLNRLGKESSKALILSEGFLVYLAEAEVIALAQDLAAQNSFMMWTVEIVSPGLLAMMQQTTGSNVSAAGAPYLFGPEQRSGFFRLHGWLAAEVASISEAAIRMNRFPPELMEAEPPAGVDPIWCGICSLVPDSMPHNVCGPIKNTPIVK